ncbi:MAG: SusC/RagA family TonB-linked outer membrane protein [Prevotellaceae bacterium]|jgi:TonB-linked SusC/RagA family outer membrane protein|nr:SusC/RagA family TonB-linked outer membrane protein [Prevotellaceae bacterium]
MELAIAQSKQVSGVVTDEAGAPLIGVSVIVKGTSIGTATDNEGRFELFVPENTKTVSVKYIGYAEIEAPAAANLRVVLKTDEKSLDEVVVTAMGILRTDRSVGYAVSKVNPNEAKQKAEPDLLRSLDGKIPGVQVGSSSAVAGSATKVLIRGNSSFLGSNDPLYVVDGIPYSNPEVVTGSRLTSSGAYGTGLSTLDPNDIESMSVLKGAAAAALYGSRAANGVVLITTKSGSKRTRLSQKKFEVTVAASYAVETVASLPEYQNSYGQGSNFQYSNSNGSWGAPFSALDSVATYSDYLRAYPDMPVKQAYQAYPNNVKDLFRAGIIADVSANLLSYNDKGNFSATVSQLKQDGAIPYSNFERTSFSVGGSQKLDNGVRVGGTLSYSNTIQNGPFFGAGNYSGSVSSFARTLLMPRNYDIIGLPYETLDNANLFPLSGVDNPLWSWKYNTINTGMYRTVTGLNAGYDITSWLSADYQFGWNQYEMKRKQVINVGSVGPKGFAGKGQITNGSYATQELESNLQLTFQHELGADFNLRAVLGHNVNQRTLAEAGAEGNEMIFKEIYNVDNTQEQTAGEGTSKRRLWALYADVLLKYKDYAFLNATLRNDHSSTLPVKNNSYFYPAVVGSLVFSDAFNVNQDILSYGKVRAGWGMVGNDASPYYVNGAFLQSAPFDGQPIMLASTTLYDPNLKPEFTTELELGAELQFFQNRAGIDFTWYDRRTTDQIAPVSLPKSTGTSRYYTNFGEMSNKGVEIGLTLVPVSLENSFKWNIYATFTKNVSEVVSLVDGVERITLSTNSTSEPQPTLQPGYPYGFLRGSVIARDDEGNPLVNPATGAYLEATELGDLGNPYPDFKASVSNTLSYKGVSLGFLFDFRVGGILVSGPASDMLGRGVTKDTEDRLGTRILSGVLADPNTREPLLDASGNKIPNTVQLAENDLWFASASTAPTFAMNSVAEFTAFDATVFRLSEISLGWDLPEKWLSKTFIGSASLSVIARNLWRYAPGFPKYLNYDPGSNAFGSGNVQGIDRESAPTIRRVGFNLKLTF